ncbi:MAG: nitroreductase [Anaerocolumna sp.]|jgi:nitroreductase|nr:nitroreductase [Anaerocolumna sp.]
MSIDAIYNRRSIRKFLKKDVSIDIIQQLIDSGRVAPSAKNRQPWKYIVFGNEHKQELLQNMETGIFREENNQSLLPNSTSGISDAKNTLRIMKEAPIIIMVINTNGKSPFCEINADDRITEICDTLSIGASIENILLKATELELGTLWIANTCFAYSELTNYLNIVNQLVGAIAVGYPDEQPLPRPRKAIEDIIEYRI